MNTDEKLPQIDPHLLDAMVAIEERILAGIDIMWDLSGYAAQKDRIKQLRKLADEAREQDQ